MNEAIPKKSLGQHWLYDSDVLDAMCDAGEVKDYNTVVEIGPGLGTLTEFLVKRAEQVVALEFDQDLARQLPKKVKADNLTVEFADCLTYNYAKLPKNYKVVANIPYYLTSNLLRVLSESPNPPSMIALLVQKEVAERVAAVPGQMSILSVSVQFYYQAILGRVVSAELFTPPPKVDSQILKLVRRNELLFPGTDINGYMRIVKAGFSQKRKKLRSSLSAGLHISKDEASELLCSVGIDPSCRPQELSLDQWHAVYLRYVQA